MGPTQSVESYRILKVKPNSPCSDIPIEELLDFLVYSTESEGSQVKFEDYLAANENKEVELTFFNIASQKKWTHKVIPKKWEGTGLLGFSLQPESYKDAHNKVIHIISVMIDSPLHAAGFKHKADYIIGTKDNIFEDVSDFIEYIQQNDNKPIEFVVYNSKEERTRVLTLTPNTQWGGDGMLGGEIGFGYAHSLPIRKPKVKAKEEKMEEKVESKEGDKREQVNTGISNTEVSGVTEEDILIGVKDTDEI